MSELKLLQIVASIVALLIAIIGHEIMHGYIAYKYGDMTAKNAGRLSINPLIHIDLFPVPINMQSVVNKGGYNAAMQVSLAGIVYNFALAAFSAMVLMILKPPVGSDSIVYLFLYIMTMQLVVINVVLGIFNLLPIPQLDGAHFLMYLALKFNNTKVAEFFYKNERYGMIIVIIILITPLKDYLLIWPVNTVLNLLL